MKATFLIIQMKKKVTKTMMNILQFQVTTIRNFEKWNRPDKFVKMTKIYLYGTVPKNQK
ncbi:MAG TPA: hypothetical protein P5538_05730 [Bacteroidales bacterium]|nr:hypothetical protein [Bacteroidales bacterium]HPD24827.1 hypothetical protein [Bacteroidales bacterium]HRS99571.1 hypothetical protein [Bacteroidales bacterium]HRT80425.1 hypothetical protein [Bacteroidales bacterium]